MMESVTNSVFWGGGNARVDLKSIQLRRQRHMPMLLKGRKEMHVESEYSLDRLKSGGESCTVLAT